MKTKQCQLTSKRGQGDTEKFLGRWKSDQALLEISCPSGCEGWDGVRSQGLGEETYLSQKGENAFLYGARTAFSDIRGSGSLGSA